jgi:hypothetical protein
MCIPPLPHPTRVVWEKFSDFSGFEAGFRRKLSLFKNLEVIFLKTRTLAET